MKIDLNDPKLTAFALGELQGQEAEEMANLLKEDPVAKQHVEEIRETAALLSSELADEKSEPDRLSVAEREKIYAGPRGAAWWRSWKVAVPAMAACFVALIVIGTLSMPEFQRFQTKAPQQAAVVTEPKTEVAKNDSQIAPVPSGAQGSEVALEDQEYGDEMVEMEAPSADMMAQAAPPQSAKIALGKGMALRDAPRMKLAEGFGGGFVPQQEQEFNTERYSAIKENEFIRVIGEALSTFSIDVDTASYANVRRFLNGEQLPPKDAVRIEEMLNYFKYDYPQPTDGRPFSVTTEMTSAPWNTKNRLVRIGLKGKEISLENRPATNLVFLLDVSGSMMEPNKLPLVQKSMKLLTEQMRPKDKVAIVVYAGSEGIALPSTSGSQKQKILDAIDALQAGGGTNGGAGINAAYKLAQDSFVKGGINRVVLATDGDFNVGTTSEGELVRMIEEKAKSGVFLSVLGFGTGNTNDSTMVKLADKGNGNYAYIDSLREAEKVLGAQAGGTLQTIAKDVKIQVEFNPKFVEAYRLIGYEKRMLNKEDFNDDTKDAGEIGAGHTVTALYEVVPKGGVIPSSKPAVDELKYQKPAQPAAKADDKASTGGDELLTVKLRYKMPESNTSTKFDVPMKNDVKEFAAASSDLRFASSVAGFGMILRDSPLKGDITIDKVLETARASTLSGAKVDEAREEFVELVKKARDIKKRPAPAKPRSVSPPTKGGEEPYGYPED